MELKLSPLAVALIAALLLILNFLPMFFFVAGTPEATMVANFLPIIFALLAVLALIRMRMFLLNFNSKWAGYMTYVAIGYTLWLFGENLWGYYASAMPKGVPGASVADTAWFLGYIFIIYGLVKANRRTLVTFKLRDTIFAGAIALFALGVIAFIIAPTLTADVSLAEKLFNLSYLVFDIVIVALALRLLMALFGSPLGIAWLIFLIGFALTAVSDSWYTYLMLTDTYFAGHISDFTYSASYILIATGALLFEAMNRKGREEKGYDAVENAYSQLKGLLMKKKGEDEVSITTAISSPDADLALIRLLAKDKRMGGVFLCLDRPHTYFLEHFAEFGIKPGWVHFVTIGKGNEQENVSFVDSAADLTSLKMTLMDAIRKMKNEHEEVFVLVDCIPTLSLYSDLDQLGRFLHDLNLAVRKEKAYQVLLLAPKGEINTYVFRFCDTNVSLA